MRSCRRSPFIWLVTRPARKRRRDLDRGCAAVERESGRSKNEYGLTDRRLLFLPRHEDGAQTIAHDEVAEATAHVGWVGGKLTITTKAGERAVFGLLEPKETARTMANYIVRLRGG
jgi:hypothetical protein